MEPLKPPPIRKLAAISALVVLIGALLANFRYMPTSFSGFYLFTLQNPLLIFLIELLWILLARESLKRWSLVRLFGFNRTRESDALFGLVNGAGFLPAWIATFPLTLMIGLPAWLQAKGWVIPSSWLEDSFWMAALVVFLLNSFVEFGVHWLWHHVPELWELHKIHHGAEEMTGLTQFREHPVLAVTMNGAKGLAFGFVGAPLSLIAGLLTLKAIQLGVQHSQVNSTWGPFGWIFMSPRAHHLHHSTDPEFHHKNFAFDITLWDRLFGTYRMGEAPERIGLLDDPINDRHAFRAIFFSIRQAIRVFARRLL